MTADRPKTELHLPEECLYVQARAMEESLRVIKNITALQAKYQRRRAKGIGARVEALEGQPSIDSKEALQAYRTLKAERKQRWPKAPKGLRRKELELLARS